MVRPIAVGLSLVGAGEKLATEWFLGWFGPRGLPLVIALILIKQEFDLQSANLILNIMAVTVALSVYAHGLTAGPGSRRYADYCEARSVT